MKKEEQSRLLGTLEGARGLFEAMLLTPATFVGFLASWCLSRLLKPRVEH
ncbi:MAG: hypothetical protein IH838_07305 [Proteobacteria bacterium]|nr:hypothetical protein [Pseudomonadota bacterium]